MSAFEKGQVTHKRAKEVGNGFKNERKVAVIKAEFRIMKSKSAHPQLGRIMMGCSEDP